MSCSILRNKEGVIETVLAPNGKTSKLYQDALSLVKDKEQALRLWATGYIPSFKKWMSNLKPETTQQIKPGVQELFDSNPELTNAVYSEILTYSGLSAEKLSSFLLEDEDNLIEKLKIGNQSVSETDFLNYLNKIININKLFEENPEFSSQIYEALGFKKDLSYNTFRKIIRPKGYAWSILDGGEKVTINSKEFKFNIATGDNIGQAIQWVIDNKGSKKELLSILEVFLKEYQDKSPENYKPLDFIINEAIENGTFFQKLIDKSISLGDIAKNNAKRIFDNLLELYYEIYSIDDISKIKTNVKESSKKTGYVFLDDRLDYFSGLSKQQKQQAQQLYSQYLDTIFPDSQVKDIMYHGSGVNIISKEGWKTGKETGTGHRGVLGYYFSKYLLDAKIYAQRAGSPKATPESLLQQGYIVSAIVNAQNKTTETEVYDRFAEIRRWDENYAGFDTVTYGQGLDENKEVVVKSKEQIHILGSKQDIEGFKKFVSGENKAKQSEVKSSPVQKTVILNNGNYLNLSEEKKKEIYDNYVNLMDRKREGKAVDMSKFDLVFNNLQVFNYKDTYIFGEWDVENNVFRGRLMSSPGIKELYGALDELFKTVDFVASVPEDIGKMLEKKGLYKLKVGKNYDFRGEEMIKNLYLSNESLVRKIFKKTPAAVTEEDFIKYDEFYNQKKTLYSFIDDYIPYSIKKEQQQNIKKDVSVSALTELFSILNKDKIDSENLMYAKVLSFKFIDFIKEQPQYESRKDIFNNIEKEIEKIFSDIFKSKMANKKYEYVKNKELLNNIESAIKDKLSIYIPKIKVDDINFYESLKELGLYDYNAFRLARKIKAGKITEEDKSTFIKDIIKNSSLNKLAIDKTDIYNNPKIYSELDSELNKTLASYLSNFGITTEILENFQDKFNIDSFATVDILNKTIYTSKSNQTDYPQQAGKLIAYMMQHNPMVSEIMRDMKKYSIYRSLSKDELLDTIGDLIAEQLYKKTKTEIPKSLLDKLKMLIHQFFINITSLRLNRINKHVGYIADNVLLQNQSLITASIYKPGAQGKKTSQVSLEEALKNDEFGNNIVNKMADYFILTGSPSLSEQGTVLRPIENHLHDLDWVSPHNMEKTHELFNKLYPDNKFVRKIEGENNDTYTWLIVPEGYKIINLEIVGKKNTVIGYDIIDKNNRIVSSYDRAKDSHTGEIEAKLIDIFTYENEKKRKTDSYGIPYILPSGKVLLLSDWRITFKAKLGYARLKDIWDYNRFVPYKSTDNLETFLDENGEPKLSTVTSFLISNKKNSEPGVINNSSGVTFTTDNPLFNKCAQ